ncbi:MAG TPA: SDR family NAD(P)-dependent oxidoreductase [Allosphingosinicella sp.]|jgi:CDP-paratose 2-epimerase
MSRPVLITGGAGFIGSNLADRLAGEGFDVIIYDALARAGVERNLDWLLERHPRRISATVADIRDEERLGRAVREAGAIFHMAAQVAVTTSLEDPRDDFTVNACGTFNLLEAVRRQQRRIPIVFASTNKVYGDLADLAFDLAGDRYRPRESVAQTGIDESRPLDFHTPYGCSKGAADQYVLDYARSYDIPAAVLRMSCIYGRRQMGNEDQGWVAHFMIRALAGETVTIYGDGRQVRDILDVTDAVETYVRAWRQIERIKGRAFNLGGGPANAVSLLELIDHIGTLTGREVPLDFQPWRAGDQRWFVADVRAARAALGLPVPRPWRLGVAGLADWLREETQAPRPKQAILAGAPA